MLEMNVNPAMRFRSASFIEATCIAIVVCLLFVPALTQEASQKTFANPQDASRALDEAVQSGDKGAILAILGPSAAEVVSSGDEVQDKNNRELFLERYTQMNRWSQQTDGTMILNIGAENWPFPIPLRKNTAGLWYFDTNNGLQEILFRRIGKNELAAIRVCRALVDAQQEYFGESRDGDSVHQYAQKIISDEGKQNGLYWKVAEGQPQSPIGPLVAYATAEGYGGEHNTPQPFHGYFFRILTSQGASVKGGAKNYIADGKMTRGFAFVAYPSEYRNSGVMTFLVNQSGIVYQKDLGDKTADLGKAMTAYNPDKTWSVTEAPELAESTQ